MLNNEKQHMIIGFGMLAESIYEHLKKLYPSKSIYIDTNNVEYNIDKDVIVPTDYLYHCHRYEIDSILKIIKYRRYEKKVAKNILKHFNFFKRVFIPCDLAVYKTHYIYNKDSFYRYFIDKYKINKYFSCCKRGKLACNSIMFGMLPYLWQRNMPSNSFMYKWTFEEESNPPVNCNTNIAVAKVSKVASITVNAMEHRNLSELELKLSSPHIMDYFNVSEIMTLGDFYQACRRNYFNIEYNPVNESYGMYYAES